MHWICADGQDTESSDSVIFRAHGETPMHVEGLTHVAIDLSSPTRTESFLKGVFGLQTLRQGYWKGEYIRIMGSPDPELANPGFLVLHLRPGISEGRLNHVGLGIRDQSVQAAVDELRQRGIYGPEDIWYQIASYTTPFPVGHPANDPGVCYADPDMR